MSLELVQSHLVLDPEKHLIFRQLIKYAPDKEPEWVDTNMSVHDTRDASGLTAEEAILLGTSLSVGKTVDEIRQQLERGEIVYLVSPKGESLRQTP